MAVKHLMTEKTKECDEFVLNSFVLTLFAAMKAEVIPSIIYVTLCY